MCGCPAFSCPLAFHDRHTGAFSCAIPVSTTCPLPPRAAAAPISGRAISSLFSPLANRRTGIPRASANRWIPAVYTSPIFPNAADDGMPYPRCQRKNQHTQPTDCSLGTYACKKILPTGRQVSVT